MWLLNNLFSGGMLLLKTNKQNKKLIEFLYLKVKPHAIFKLNKHK